MTYVISNIKCHKPIQILDPNDDELVFLNMATNWEAFKDVPCLKRLYCRERDNGGYFVRDEWVGRELALFDDFKVLSTGWRFYYPDGKTPTTGFWAWNELVEAGKDVVLVNFMPNRDFSTLHWVGHDWAYEQNVIDERAKVILL